MNPQVTGHCHGAKLLAMSPALTVQAAPERVVAPALTFAEVYREYLGFVWRNARALGVGTAAVDDVVQEIFVVVHRRLPEFEGRSAVRTWLWGSC